MDPNATLEEMGQLADQILSDEPHDPHVAHRLAELVQAMDSWLSRGGFLPNGWAR